MYVYLYSTFVNIYIYIAKRGGGGKKVNYQWDLKDTQTLNNNSFHFTAPNTDRRKQFTEDKSTPANTAFGIYYFNLTIYSIQFF